MKLKVKKLGSFRGLMFRRRPKIPVFIAFDGKGIHTWFVFYPIRVVFLDTNCIVTDIRWRIKPFSTYRSRIPSAFVIESRVDDSWLPTLGERVDLEIG